MVMRLKVHRLRVLVADQEDILSTYGVDQGRRVFLEAQHTTAMLERLGLVVWDRQLESLED